MFQRPGLQAARYAVGQGQVPRDDGVIRRPPVDPQFAKALPVEHRAGRLRPRAGDQGVLQRAQLLGVGRLRRAGAQHGTGSRQVLVLGQGLEGKGRIDGDLRRGFRAARDQGRRAEQGYKRFHSVFRRAARRAAITHVGVRAAGGLAG